MQSLPTITCGLNLGQIFSLRYSYEPQAGVSIVLIFVNESGEYNPPKLLPLQKTSITIGAATFSLYPIRYNLSLSSGRRVIEVEFVDDSFKLDNYYIALTGRGCGQNVFNLGRPVDSRTSAQKISTAIDPVAQQIKDLTQFPDYEYSFNDFLTVMRQKINVTLLATFDTTLTNTFEGTFRDVLGSWCSYYNFSYFFENGALKIFNPSQLTINLPAKPANAIEYTVEEDIRDTYGKTVFNWFQQDGGEYPLSQTNSNSGPLNVRTATLKPIGGQFNLPQTYMDLNQVAAAQYGKEFWFLYNYNKGTVADQCGWSVMNSGSIQNTDVYRSVTANKGVVVAFNEDIFESRYNAYLQYGNSIAGRWYMTDEIEELATNQNYTWFDETDGQIFNFDNVDQKQMNIDYLTPTNGTYNYIDNTTINSYFPGINYIGNRMAYYDTLALPSGQFELGSIEGLVNQTYSTLFTMPAVEAMNFTEVTRILGNQRFVASPNSALPQDIITFMNDIPSKATLFNPRFTSIPVKGITRSDYASLKSSQNQPDNVQIVNGTNGPQVITNTSVLKTLQNGAYTVYYDKYAKCASASTSDSFYGYQFQPRQISTDNQIGVTFSKQSKNTYKLSRDYSFINNLVNNSYLPTLAQARTFSTKRVSFSLNTIYTVPTDFLSNGLVGMSLDIGDSGLTASYSFSNEVLKVIDNTQLSSNIEQQMKNSWTRTYRPQEIIT